MKTIFAFSYDMDGCVYLENDRDDIQGIMKRNDPLFRNARLSDGIKYVFCGSSRQTPHIDAHSATLNNGPLAATILPVIAEHIGAMHNTFLFGDIATYSQGASSTPVYHLQPPGTLYQDHIDGKIDIRKKSYAYLDLSKILLIYAQVCNLCIHEPDAEEIIFNFYDDRTEILNGIGNFFKDLSIFLSYKVTVNLWHYSDFDYVTVPSLYHTFQGAGLKAHENYYQVIVKLIQSNKFTPCNPRESWFEREFIEELIALGTNGSKSHERKIGLIDSRLSSQEQTASFARPNTATETSLHFDFRWLAHLRVGDRSERNEDKAPSPSFARKN